jgi:uncharacterized protein YegJ (DUF2314 family)
MLNVSSDDEVMNTAIQYAKESLPLFIAELIQPKPTQTYFSIKAMIPYGVGGSTEHIWLEDVTYSGSTFMGKLANEPVYVKGFHLHDQISIKPEFVSDWMIIDSGRLLGGFTLLVLLKNMTPDKKAEFQAASGFTFSDEAELPG